MSKLYVETLNGAKDFSLVLGPGARIVLEFTFASDYEAAVAYHDMSEAARTGEVRLHMYTKDVEVVK